MGIGNEMANATEFMYEKKNEGLYKLARIAMYASYVVVPIAIIVILCIVLPSSATGYVIGISLIVGVPLVGCFLMPKIIIPGTIRYVQIEYRYTIKGGTMTVERVYGRKTVKEWMPAATISTFDYIKPLDTDPEIVKSAEFKNKYLAVPTMSEPDNYVAVFTNEKGEKCLVAFQATAKALQIMKFLNRNTVVRPVRI